MKNVMNWTTRIAATVAVIFAGAQSAHAVQVSDNFEASGWVWIMDRIETSSKNPDNPNATANKSGLGVDEAELDFAWKIDETWKANVGFIYGYWGNAADANNNYPMWMMKRANIAGKNLWGEGSKLVVGMQGSSYVVNIEGPWGMNWLDGYTLGLQDSGFYARHEKGIMAGGKVDNFRYDLFLHSGEGFAGKSSIDTDNGRNITGSVGYDFMTGGLVYLSYGMNGASSGKRASTVGSAAIMLKNAFPVDVLLEYSMLDGTDKDGLGYSGCNTCKTTGDIKANAMAAHLNYNMNEKWGLWARYVTGNDDFVNKAGGVKYGQWGPSMPGTVKTIKSRISFGPTYTIVADKLKAAAVYEIGQLSDNAKADTANNAAGLKEVSAIRFHMAAFF